MDHERILPERKDEYSTSLLSKEDWPQCKEQLIKLVNDCFPEYQFTPEFVEQLFVKTFLDNITVLLQDGKSSKLIGFTTAHISTQHLDTARIEMTGIAAEKRGQKLVGTLLTKLEEELKKRGVETVTRTSRINDGYADAIERHYQDRILEKRDLITEGDSDPKRYFKIRL